ncbi:MAG: aminotransferase class IV [Pseudomonadota bacterium]
MAAVLWLNGRFCRPETASVSIFDRGFMFGDGVYEVIPVRGGRPFHLEAHLVRLEASLKATRIKSTHSRDEWRALITDVLAKSEELHAQIYLQITRGVAPYRSHDVAAMTPTELLMVQPVSTEVLDPLSLSVCEDYRWLRGDIKSTSLIAATLLRIQAREQGAMDALMHRDGVVTECTSSNIFAVFGDSVVTPPADQQILHGITRSEVLQLRGLPVTMVERTLTLPELMTADEVFVTSSNQAVRPVESIDDQSFSTTGSFTAQIAAALEARMGMDS